MTAGWTLADPYSSRIRPALQGHRAAVSAPHPMAASAAIEVLAAGGNAADATIAAQAVVCVLMPEAAGLGGDGFFLLRSSPGRVTAVNAAGRTGTAHETKATAAGATVTVPGLVAGLAAVAERFGRLPLAETLGPAIALADSGPPIRRETARAVQAQRSRLVAGKAEAWPFFAAAAGRSIAQPALARMLRDIGQDGPTSFYGGPIADAITRAVRGQGGFLQPSDLSAHMSVVTDAITVAWRGRRVHLQPPMSQGILLGMVLKALDGADLAAADRDHAAIEATLSSFGSRNHVHRGAALLDEPLAFDTERASGRGGPRAYLHTAGVAVSDADGLVVSSLLSVFDDFGSAIYVPEGGFLLNNRGVGFTTAPNDAGPAKMPVHTLAPIIVEAGGDCLALATPGADGQIQTLLQLLLALTDDDDIAAAIDAPRWRSENGRLLIELGHPSGPALSRRGHRLVDLQPGDTRFGGVVAAGLRDGRPFAAADWRRENWTATR